MKANINLKKIFELVKKVKRRLCFGLLVVVIVIVGLFLLAGQTAEPSLKGAVFYYKGDGANSKLFYMSLNREPEYLLSVPSEEMDLEKYKVPQHSYISRNGESMIYFERVEEIPIKNLGEGLTAYRIIYKPKYVDLKNNSIREIKQPIDSGGLVFSPDDKEIAWVLRVEESTIDELEVAGKKREVWLSSADGSKARHLTVLDDKVILLQRWHGDYLYFWGMAGTGYYSFGRIDVRTGRIRYLQPKYCLQDLTNCQNFRFSYSGEFFVYEAGIIKEDKESVELFVEDFDQTKSWQIFVANYISDRLWLPSGKAIIYTEQLTEKKVGLREKIHLVDLDKEEDKEIYSGNYISQIIPDSSGRYLYFLEKESDEKFNLVRLDIKEGQTEIIDFGAYNQLRIFASE